jgi:hypothetical protein
LSHKPYEAEEQAKCAERKRHHAEPEHQPH